MGVLVEKDLSVAAAGGYLIQLLPGASDADIDKIEAGIAQVGQVTGLTPVLWDERRTTVEAHNILHASGKRMKQHKKTVDAVAATLILEGYLTRRRTQS